MLASHRKLHIRARAERVVGQCISLAMLIKRALKRKVKTGPLLHKDGARLCRRETGRIKSTCPAACLERCFFVQAWHLAVFFYLHWMRSVSEPVLVEIDASRTATKFRAVAITCHVTATESCRSRVVVNVITADFEMF